MIRALVDSDAVESASALPRVRAIVQRARGISVAGADTMPPKGRGPFLRTAALLKLNSRAQTPLIRPILGTLSLPETPSPWERASVQSLSLIHISEPTRLGMISYAVFCLK